MLSEQYESFSSYELDYSAPRPAWQPAPVAPQMAPRAVPTPPPPLARRARRGLRSMLSLPACLLSGVIGTVVGTLVGRAYGPEIATLLSVAQNPGLMLDPLEATVITISVVLVLTTLLGLLSRMSSMMHLGLVIAGMWAGTIVTPVASEWARAELNMPVHVDREMQSQTAKKPRGTSAGWHDLTRKPLPFIEN